MSWDRIACQRVREDDPDDAIARHLNAGYLRDMAYVLRITSEPLEDDTSRPSPQSGEGGRRKGGSRLAAFRAGPEDHRADRPFAGYASEPVHCHHDALTT